MNNKYKQLEFIQNIINRMERNSFVLKGWAVTLITSIFILANKDTNKMYYLIAYVPIIIFWFLDSYYLQQERLFRSLYNKVRLMEIEKVDFDMNIKCFKTLKKNQFVNCIVSKTEILFYFPLSITPIIVIILGKYI